MEAIILAAGEGKKLRPLTLNIPKVMLPVGGRPILEYVIKSLARNDIRDITIVIGYYGDKIKRYFGDGHEFGAHIKYVVQEKQLGTAHALYQARGAEDFLVVPGDNLIAEKCIEKLINSEKNTILAVHSDRASKYGVVEVLGNRVREIIEKPPDIKESLVFTGIAHLNKEIFGVIDEAMASEIYDLPEVLMQIDGLRATVSNCEWLDAVYPWDLLRLNSYVLSYNSRILSGKIETSAVIGNVSTGEKTRIGAHCYILGAVKIGKCADVGPNTVVMPDTTLGEGVTIGAQCYVENSIIMDGATIGEGSYIKDSIIASGVVIEPKTTLLSGNFRKVINGGEVFSGFGGPVIGTRAVIGASSVIKPGILVGADSRIGALKVIYEDVKSGESVR